jgi:K+-transporting ATPase A subunit
MRIVRIIIIWAVFAAGLYILQTPEWLYKWGGLAMACLAEMSIHDNYSRKP